jgi:hypothetical protein
MSFNVDSQVKPLYANLLRVGIGNYLISEKFNHLCIEINIDQLWKNCEHIIRNRNNVLVLIPGYTGDAEDALGVFLTELAKSDKKTFIDIIGKIIVDFSEWSKGKQDLSKIKKSLIDLSYNENELEWIFSTKQVTAFPPQKTPEFKIKAEVDKNLCFVLMPFDETFNPIYTGIIKKATDFFKLDCKRADEIFGTKPIIEDIWEYIQKANFLIADLTGRNPNVFYELGVAHALKKKVILITQKMDDLPFDLRHYRCIIYENSIAGAGKLEDGLKSTIDKLLKES